MISIVSTLIFSSPEPKAQWEFIGSEGSVVRRRPSTISIDFSQTTRPIETKFHM